jgi:predicted DsbA family dithiol-disulfide isomerase
MESDLITADAIEATEFPDLVGRYRVSAVPTTVVNGTPVIRGALPEEAFLEQVLRSVTTATESAAVAPPGRGPRR